MPSLPDAENVRWDAEARRALEAGEGIPAEEVHAWLRARLDGHDAPMPKARAFK